MIRPLELFQRELDEDQAGVAQIFVTGHRMDRSKWLLGRCTRCGSHITSEKEFCFECLGASYCSCHECMQVASLHRMLQNDLFWAKRDFNAEQVYRNHLAFQIQQMRNISFCREVAA